MKPNNKWHSSAGEHMGLQDEPIKHLPTANVTLLGKDWLVAVNQLKVETKLEKISWAWLVMSYGFLNEGTLYLNPPLPKCAIIVCCPRWWEGGRKREHSCPHPWYCSPAGLCGAVLSPLLHKLQKAHVCIYIVLLILLWTSSLIGSRSLLPTLCPNLMNNEDIHLFIISHSKALKLRCWTCAASPSPSQQCPWDMVSGASVVLQVLQMIGYGSFLGYQRCVQIYCAMQLVNGQGCFLFVCVLGDDDDTHPLKQH